jgi:cyclophilin family peptidyl-prolyl cis-trans isomerase
MSTYDDQDDDQVGGRSGIRSRAWLAAVGMITVTAAALFVGAAIRDGDVAPTTLSVAVAVAVETVPPTVAVTAPPTTVPVALDCPNPQGGNPQTKTFPAAPKWCIDMNAAYRAKVKTDKGTFWIALNQNAAPEAVNAFVYLTRYGFYDGLAFHKVLPNFIIQTGSPTPDGEGGPGFALPKLESGQTSFAPGVVAMADVSNGSQFFVASGASAAGLNPAEFSQIGEVNQGLDVVKRIDALGVGETGTTSELVTVKSLEIVATNETGPNRGDGTGPAADAAGGTPAETTVPAVSTTVAG